MLGAVKVARVWLAAKGCDARGAPADRARCHGSRGSVRRGHVGPCVAWSAATSTNFAGDGLPQRTAHIEADVLRQSLRTRGSSALYENSLERAARDRLVCRHCGLVIEFQSRDLCRTWTISLRCTRSSSSRTCTSSMECVLRVFSKTRQLSVGANEERVSRHQGEPRRFAPTSAAIRTWEVCPCGSCGSCSGTTGASR